MSLLNPQSKMSKSAPNPRSRIMITATEEETRQLLRTAVTDAQNSVSYDPEARAGVSNLLELWAQCDPARRSPQQLADELAAEGAGLGRLKAVVGDAIAAELRGVRDRYHEALDRHAGRWVDEIQEEGAERARRNAAETMRMVRDAVGLASSS